MCFSAMTLSASPGFLTQMTWKFTSTGCRLVVIIRDLDLVSIQISEALNWRAHLRRERERWSVTDQSLTIVSKKYAEMDIVGAGL